MGDSKEWQKPGWFETYHAMTQQGHHPMQDVASAPFLAATFGLKHPIFIIPTDTAHPVPEPLGLDFLMSSLPTYQLLQFPVQAPSEAYDASTEGTPPLLDRRDAWVPIQMHRFAKFPNLDGSDPSPDSQNSAEDTPSPDLISPAGRPAFSPNNLAENFQSLSCISIDADHGISDRPPSCQKAPPTIVLEEDASLLENVPEFSPEHTTSSPKSLVLPSWFHTAASRANSQF